MKRVIKIICFLVIFILIFFLITKILWLPKNSITEFYEEPRNSLDIVYLGSSNAYAHFNTTLAYNEYGFTTGMLAVDSEPIIALKYLIKESEKYQKPKLYVIDMGKIIEQFVNMDDAQIRKVTDSMKNSKNRIDCINSLLYYNNYFNKNYFDYYFSFVMYHDIWKDKEAIDKNTKGNKDLYKGYLFSIPTSKIEKIIPNQQNSEIEMLNNQTKKVLEDLFKYIKDNKLNVLFVIPKRTFNEEDIPIINSGVKTIKENGFEVIDFNDLEDFKVDFNHDFYNYAHLNVYGATKYTLYFSRYLKEHYDLKDHRGDIKYESWNKEYERFKKDYKKIINTDFDELLKEYKNQGF